MANKDQQPLGEQRQLPIWSAEHRALPNAFARSALFNVANSRKGERDNYKRRSIATLRGATLTYTGEELRQDDEDVYLQVLHLARLQHLGTEVQFSAYAMIRDLEWTSNGRSYKRLIDSLDRLKASAVAVTVERPDGSRENYTGSLIRAFRWKETGVDAPSRSWTVLLEPEIVALFSPNSYSRLDWQMRLKLPPMAKWLHSFYITHQNPYSYKVETLRELSGSEVKELRQFRHRLKKNLELLTELGFFTEARIDPRLDLVVVTRNLALSNAPR
jgi:hypothetical protein